MVLASVKLYARLAQKIMKKGRSIMIRIDENFVEIANEVS
jgi:hypothetical protein